MPLRTRQMSEDRTGIRGYNGALKTDSHLRFHVAVYHVSNWRGIRPRSKRAQQGNFFSSWPFEQGLALISLVTVARTVHTCAVCWELKQADVLHVADKTRMTFAC